MDVIEEEAKANEGSVQPQPGPQPAYQPTYAPYPPPRRQNSVAEGILKNPVYIGIGIALSVFLLWLGLLFQAIAMGSTDSGQIKTLMQISLIIYNLGIAGLVIILLFVGLGRRDYPEWVRVSLIIGAVLLILWGFTNIWALLNAAALGGAFRSAGMVFLL